MKGYIPTLDGWRAIAIIGVMAFHGFQHYFDVGGRYENPWAKSVTAAGAKGVDIFFAISGFLICSRLLQEEEERGGISLKGFYIRRAFRILPPALVYLFTLLIFTLLGLMAVYKSGILASLFFYRNYRGADYNTAHFWSLSVEEHFYLLFPLLLTTLRRRNTMYVTVIISFAIAIWRYLSARYSFIAPSWQNIQHTDQCADGLLWGCWTALLVHSPANRDWLKRYLKTWVWLLLAAGLILNAKFRTPVSQMIQAALIPWLLLGTVIVPSSIVSRVLENRLLRWIGRLSYSLYLWQQLFLRLHDDTSLPTLFALLQKFPLNFVFSFIAATLSYYLVEQPLVRRGHRLSKWLLDKDYDSKAILAKAPS